MWITLVSVSAGRAISNTIMHFSSVWAVNRNMVIVSTESVSVCIWVREQSSLKHLIKRRLKTGNQMAGGEGRLLYILEVIFRVSIEHHLSERNQRIISMGPDFCNVENVPFVLETVFKRHNLHFHWPGNRSSFTDCFKHVLSRMIRVASSQSQGLLKI